MHPEELLIPLIPTEEGTKFSTARMKSLLCSHGAERLWTSTCESGYFEKGPLAMLPEKTL